MVVLLLDADATTAAAGAAAIAAEASIVDPSHACGSSYACVPGVIAPILTQSPE